MFFYYYFGYNHTTKSYISITLNKKNFKDCRTPCIPTRTIWHHYFVNCTFRLFAVPIDHCANLFIKQLLNNRI